MEARNQNYIQEVTRRLNLGNICYQSVHLLLYGMMFIYCNWVSTQWQWSVVCIQIKRDSTKAEIIQKTIKNNRKTQNTQN
jgi:hypothetical protein